MRKANRESYRKPRGIVQVGYIPHERIGLRYAVKEFKLLMARAESPGFDWSKKKQSAALLAACNRLPFQLSSLQHGGEVFLEQKALFNQLFRRLLKLVHVVFA